MIVMEFSDSAKFILQTVGGKSNIKSFSHCMTRLRFVLNDENIADDEKIKSADEVKGIIKSNNQYQVIIGENVEKYYKEIDKLISVQEKQKYNSIAEAVAFIAKSFSKPKNKIPESITLYSPVSGRIIPLSEVADPVFSSEILGKGFAVIPSSGKIIAPFDGSVKMLAETFHALEILSDSGIKLLIHMGIETAKLKGRHFNPKVYENSVFKKGDTLIEFDIASVIQEGFDITISVVIMNSDEYKDFTVEKAEKLSLQKVLVLTKI